MHRITLRSWIRLVAEEDGAELSGETEFGAHDIHVPPPVKFEETFLRP